MLQNEYSQYETGKKRNTKKSNTSTDYILELTDELKQYLIKKIVIMKGETL